MNIEHSVCTPLNNLLFPGTFVCEHEYSLCLMNTHYVSLCFTNTHFVSQILNISYEYSLYAHELALHVTLYAL